MENAIKKLVVDNDDLEWLYAPDMEYHDYGDCKRHLQMIVPFRREWKEKESYPLLLFIPGAAWHKQEMYNSMLQYARLAERGYVVAAMEYRESDIAKFPAQIEDVGNALEFLETAAEQFHIDMSRIFLGGNSSGGHTAMMAALMNAHGLTKKLPKISGVIIESGSTDILTCAKDALPPWMKVRPSAVLLGIERLEGNEETARKASCEMYVTDEAQIPPVLMLHGDADGVVSVENSRMLYRKLVEKNKQVTYYELVGTDHGGAPFWTKEVLDVIQEFAESVLKAEGGVTW